MQDRKEVMRQYQDLRVLLNRSNKHKNQNSIYCFKLIKSELGILQLFATVEIGANRSLFLLASKSQKGKWKIDGDFQFSELKLFCCSWLNQIKIEIETTTEIEKLLTEQLRSF